MTRLAGGSRSGAMLALMGLSLLALTVGGLALHVPGADSVGSDALTAWFVTIMAVAAAIYFGAVALVLRRALPPYSIWFVLVVAAAMRLVVIGTAPFLSSDAYRYVWDGRVQQAGINPYRYVPATLALKPLRDTGIYPHVNRAESALTIYPPMAQVIFAAIAAVASSITVMKLAMVAFEAVAVLAMLRLLALAGLPSAQVLIYAWNPLGVWAFAGNGHVDAAVIGVLSLALLARAARRDTLVGVVLAGAILIKFLPGAVAPAFWRRWDWKMPTACVATIGALYAGYGSVGWKVLGFLPDYGVEERLVQGKGFWLLAGLGRLISLPDTFGAIYLALAAGALAGLAWWVVLGRARPGSGQHQAGPQELVRVADGCVILGSALMLAISPHYPWYYVWLALPSCLCPRRSVIYLSTAALLLYLDPLHDDFVWPSLVFVPAMWLAVADGRRTSARAVASPNVVQERL